MNENIFTKGLVETGFGLSLTCDYLRKCEVETFINVSTRTHRKWEAETFINVSTRTGMMNGMMQ